MRLCLCACGSAMFFVSHKKRISQNRVRARVNHFSQADALTFDIVIQYQIDFNALKLTMT